MLLLSAAEAFIALTRITWDPHPQPHPLAPEPHLGQTLGLAEAFLPVVGHCLLSPVCP